MLNTEDLYYEVGSILLQRRGKTFTDALRRGMMGLPAQKAFELMIEHESLSVAWQDLQRESDEIFEMLLPQKVALMPGLVSLLDRLDATGRPRCVATSSRMTFVNRALSLTGIAQRFDFIVTAEHVPRGKPFPDIYLRSAEKFGIPPQSLLVLEDSANGAKAGVTAGACVVAVPGAHSADHDFSGVYDIVPRLDDERLMEQLLS